MLDPRIYRAALVPVLLALIVGAFSLSDRPRPIGTTLEPDAFSVSRAMADLNAWVAAYPARRAGKAAAHASRSAWAREAEKASGSSVVPMGRGRSLSENAPTISANRTGMRAAR